MGSFIHRDSIADRLEIARAMGLLTNYLVSRIGSASRADASVRVWRSAGATEAAVREYLTRLLHGLVAGHQIVVTAPLPSSEPVAEISTEDERIGGTQGAPVPAAA